MASFGGWNEPRNALILTALKVEREKVDLQCGSLVSLHKEYYRTPLMFLIS